MTFYHFLRPADTLIMFVHCVCVNDNVCVCAVSPLAVVVAEVLVDGGLQIVEVLLHCSSDGSLDDPGNTETLFLYTVKFDFYKRSF